MILINTKKESFYTLLKNGELHKISSLQNNMTWFNYIYCMSKLLEDAKIKERNSISISR